MPTYDVILPEGHVILRDRATGAELTLSAADGPLSLGKVELSFALELKRAQSVEKALWGEAKVATPASAAVPDEVAEALARFRMPAPGSGPEAELPFLSPAENLTPPLQGKPEGAEAPPPVRALEAPLEALTEAEFEKTLESLVLARDEAAREAEFLEEIEADPADVAELRARKNALGERFARVSKRFEAWRELQRRIDEERSGPSGPQ